MPQHREEVACTTREDKEVPDRVTIPQALVSRVEDDATCIEESSRQKPPDSGVSNLRDQRLCRDGAKPPHRDVWNGCQGGSAKAANGLHEDTGDRHRPHNGKQCVAHWTAQRSEHEGRVAAGDENEDCRMIDHSQDAR